MLAFGGHGGLSLSFRSLIDCTGAPRLNRGFAFRQWAGRDVKMARQSHPEIIQEALPMARNTARERLEAALARIDDPKGEGARTCLTVYREQAKAAADAADARAKSGLSLGPLDGTIVSIKDLFDVAGEVTRAGSRILAEDGKPATADAPVVHR